MAFWQPLLMDSWNPFSSSFWTYQNLMGSSLNKLRQQLRDQLAQHLPDMLKDPLISEELTDIVITPYGHCFNRESLSKHWAFQSTSGKSIENYTCPLTNQKLNVTLLIEGKHKLDLKNILSDINEKRKQILLKINKMNHKNKEDIEKRLEEFRKDVKKATEKFVKILDEIKELALIKERLKLDPKKSTHLEFWRTSHTSFEKKLNSFTEVKDETNKTYKIPQSIYNLMLITAHREFDSKEALLETIKVEYRKERGGFFASPSLSRHEKLLLSENLDAVDFRKEILPMPAC